MPSIFLSHSWDDKPFVRKFADQLVQAGLTVWLDEAEINVGESLIQKIAEGIEEVDYVAAVISTKSVKSEWVQKELSLAMTREIAGRCVMVLPVVIESCELPAYLKDKLYTDFRDPTNYENEFNSLLRAVGIRKSESKFEARRRKKTARDTAAIEKKIEDFYSHIDKKEYTKAFAVYCSDLSAPLYESGANRITAGLLNTFYTDEEYGLLFLDESAQAWTHYQLAKSCKPTGKPRRAVTLFERSLDLRNKRHEFDQSIAVIRDLSRTTLSLGELALTEKYLRDGLELAQNTESKGKELGLHRQLGILYTYEGRFKEASNELSHLPHKFRSARHSDISPLSESCLNALLTGSTVKALHDARDMYRLAQKYQYKFDMVHGAWLLGLSYLLSDDLRRVEHHLNEAFTLCKEIGFVELEPDILLARARYYNRTDNLDRATMDSSRGLVIAKWCGYTLKQAEIHNFIADIELQGGNIEQAGKHALDAYHIASNGISPHCYKLALDEAQRICDILGVKPLPQSQDASTAV